jgi:hypothetical protein
MLWQIPGIAYVINAAVISFIITGKASGWGASIAAVMLLVLTLPLTLALVKNRVFQIARSEYARELLDAISPNEHISDLPTQTEDAWELVKRGSPGTSRTDRIANRTQSALGKRKAYNALLVTLLLTHVLQVGIAVVAPVAQ